MIIVVALIHVAAIFGLLRAFDIDVVPQSVKSITSFAIALDPEPEPEPETPPDPEPEGASAPPAPKAEPKPKAAPKPKVVVKPAPDLPPTNADGAEDTAGAADAGEGSGGGGEGAGTGSGGSGTGMGGPVIASRAIKIAGDIRDARDYPRSGASVRRGNSVTVFFTVGTDGVPRDCSVTRSSGDPEADRITCRLILQRFRYRPAIDRDGNPVPERTGWRQSFFR